MAEVEKILGARREKPKASPVLASPEGGEEVGSGLGDFLSSFLD
jgi:hypothetical protein